MNLKHYYLPLILTGASGMSLGQSAGGSVESRYDFTLDGKRAGELRVVRRNTTAGGVPAVETSTSLNLRIRRFLFRYSLETTDTAVLSASGLESYTAQATEDGKESSVNVTRVGDHLRIDYREKGDSGSDRIERSYYDATSAEYPELTVGPDRPKRTLRILDLDTFDIVRTTITHDGRDRLKLGGREFDCVRVCFRHRKGNGIRWLAIDETGPLLIKEEGNEDGDSYAIVLTSYRPAPGVAQ